MQNETIDIQIAAYLSGNLSASDREALLAWVEEHADHRAYFDEAVSIWALAQQYEPAISVDAESAWQRMDARLPPAKVVALPRRRIADKWFGIAASLLFLLSLGYWWAFSDRMVTVDTVADERRHIELPDGSQVWLNASSQLTYSARFLERTLTLSGEAFFEVVRDTLHPFVIFTGQATTRVLGTSFNVRAYPTDETVAVTVSTGKVLLQDETDPTDKVDLTPGQTGVYLKAEEKVVAAPQPLTNATAWKERRLSFRDTPLEQVIPALENYFGRDISLANTALRQCTIVGDYSNPTLAEVLQAFAFSLDLQVDSTAGGVIVLQGEGCE